jgi:hypothetical protein
VNRDQRSLDLSLPLLNFAAQGEGVHVDLRRIIAGRILISASPGGGKSHLIRYLCEQLSGVIPQLIVDVEGEYASLKAVAPYVWIGSSEDGADLQRSKATIRSICRSLTKSGASVILDLGGMLPKDRQELAAMYFGELMSFGKADWRPMLVIIDEAQELCPEEGTVASSDPVIDVVARGRKRGYGVVIATQRISDLDKSAANCVNRLIGRTTLDTDMARSAKELGFRAREAVALKKLRPGQWYAFGSAIDDGEGVLLTRSGDIKSVHPDGSKAEIVIPTQHEIACALQALQAHANDGPAEDASDNELIEEIARLREQLASAKLGNSSDPADIRRAVDHAERPLFEQIRKLELSHERAKNHARSILLDMEELPPSGQSADGHAAPTPEETNLESDIAPVITSAQKWDEKQLKMLAVLTEFGEMPSERLAKRSGQSVDSSSFRARRKALKDAGLIAYPRRGTVGPVGAPG